MGEFPHIDASGDFSRHRHDGERAASLGFAASQWHVVDQPNKLLWGGARERGKRAYAHGMVFAKAESRSGAQRT